MLNPGPRKMKLTLLKLSPKDNLTIREIHHANVVSIWHGNHTCSTELQKCPFNVHQILFSNVTSVLYRTIELQLDQRIHDTRIINVDLFTTGGKVSNGQV